MRVVQWWLQAAVEVQLAAEARRAVEARRAAEARHAAETRRALVVQCTVVAKQAAAQASHKRQMVVPQQSEVRVKRHPLGLQG